MGPWTRTSLFSSFLSISFLRLHNHFVCHFASLGNCLIDFTTSNVNSHQTQACSGPPLIIIYILYGFYSTPEVVGSMMNNNTLILNSSIIHVTRITGMCVLVKSHITVYSSLLIEFASTVLSICVNLLSTIRVGFTASCVC